jgi:hypothetical protein
MMTIIGKFFRNVGTGFRDTYQLTKFVWKNKILMISMFVLGIVGVGTMFPIHFSKVSAPAKSLFFVFPSIFICLLMIVFMLFTKKLFSNKKIVFGQILKEIFAIIKTSDFWILTLAAYAFSLIKLNFKSPLLLLVDIVISVSITSLLTQIVYEKVNIKKCWLFVEKYFSRILGSYLFMMSSVIATAIIPLIFLACWKVLLGIIPNLSVITNPKVVKIVMLSSFGIVMISVALIVGAAFYSFYSKSYKEFLEKK